MVTSLTPRPTTQSSPAWLISKPSTASWAVSVSAQTRSGCQASSSANNSSLARRRSELLVLATRRSSHCLTSLMKWPV